MCALRNVLENVQDFKSNVGSVQLLGEPPQRPSSNQCIATPSNLVLAKRFAPRWKR
jgi:hypothetical protein